MGGGPHALVASRTAALASARRATGRLALLALLAGCQGVPAAEGWSTPPCEASSAAPIDERLDVAGRFGIVRFGRCGDLAYIDPSQALYQVSAALDEDPTQRFDGALGLTLSDDPSALMVDDADGERFLLSGAGEEPVPMPTVGGFTSVGARSVPWACEDGQLGQVDAAGFVPMVDDVRCDLVYPARGAIAYAAASTLALRVLTLADGEVLDLSEVPYIAVQRDPVWLSNDGSYLFHRPQYSPVPREGIFDLRRPTGERYLGAPQASRELVAADAGHARAIPIDDGESLVWLTEDRRLVLVEGASALDIAPDGSALLVVRDRSTAEAVSLSLAVMSTDGEEAALLDIAYEPTWYVRSSNGQRLAFGASARSSRPAPFWTFDWETRTVVERADTTGISRAELLTNDGGLLVRDISWRARWLPADGSAGPSLDDGYVPTTFPTARGAVLWYASNDNAEHQLIHVEGSAAEQLYRGELLERVLVDERGERIAYVRVYQDPLDATQLRSTLSYGGL